MSPLAHHTIANPTLDLTSTRPAAAVALSATEAPAPAAPPSSYAADATLILGAFSPGTRRQLELTVNALSRSFRKAIRHAERLERDNAPIEEQDAAWERVEHRSALLQDFLKSLALPAAAVPAPEPASAPVPASTPESAVPAAGSLVPATNQKPPQTAPKTQPSALAAPVLPFTSDEAALFTGYLAEFRRVRAMPVSCRAERRRQERAGHQLITKINRQGDAFANRMYEAMKEIDAQEKVAAP